MPDMGILKVTKTPKQVKKETVKSKNWGAYILLALKIKRRLGFLHVCAVGDTDGQFHCTVKARNEEMRSFKMRIVRKITCLKVCMIGSQFWNGSEKSLRFFLCTLYGVEQSLETVKLKLY